MCKHEEIKVKMLVTQLCLFAIPWTVASVHRILKGKNTGVGCHSLLQGIFPTQGSNLGLLDCRQILYHLRHQGSPYRKNKDTYKSVFLGEKKHRKGNSENNEILAT